MVHIKINMVIFLDDWYKEFLRRMILTLNLFLKVIRFSFWVRFDGTFVVLWCLHGLEMVQKWFDGQIQVHPLFKFITSPTAMF